jgi:hypothetical protein
MELSKQINIHEIVENFLEETLQQIPPFLFIYLFLLKKNASQYRG